MCMCIYVYMIVKRLLYEVSLKTINSILYIKLFEIIVTLFPLYVYGKIILH